MKILIFLFLLNFYTGSLASVNVDPLKTIIWGPGLNPSKIVMPARYFFLQLVDSDGKNLTNSAEEGIIAVQIKAQNRHNQPARTWIQILDCKDGSYIVRYKIWETCYNFQMTLKVKNQPLAIGSVFEKGPVYEEECYCPATSLKTWLQDYQCSKKYLRMSRDLEAFPKINFDKIRDDLIREYDKPHSVSICHYVIKDNRIYRKCYGQHVGFKIFSDNILLSLARKVTLPDVEFFMNLGDWPLVPKTKTLYPIFSWCGSTDTNDIILPTYDITESSLQNMGRVMLDMLSIQGNIKVPWDEKIEKAFWRGRDSRRERLDLIDIAKKHPDLFNVSITNFFFFKDEISKYGPGTTHVSFFDFFKYKYQLNIDGTVAAYRQPYLLAGDSLVFKQESKYYEYFYDHLIPSQHYIPLKRDLSDIVEKIAWARLHDAESHKIAKAGRVLMRDIAMPQDVFCYHVLLLQEWRDRIENKIELLLGMEEVQQPEHVCVCSSTKSQNKDEL